MCNFTLSPSLGISEKEFANKIGKENFQILYNQSYKENKNICFGCGYEPENISKLQLHLIDWDGIDFNSANIVLLCEACHMIKHIDVAVKNDYIKLCNSKLTQGDLVNKCRNKQLKSYIDFGDIFILEKKTPEEFLNNILDKNFDQKKNEKIKVVFTKKFNWII